MTDKGAVKILEEALLGALARELTSHGFTARIRQQEFIRVAKDCTWVVHVGFVRRRNDLDATVDLGVSLTAIEDLLKTVGWNQKGGATIGAELGNLVDRRPRRWTMETEADTARVALEIRAEFEKFGIDWLQRFSHLETVYETLLPNDMQSRLIMPLQTKRCMILLALALLLRTKEEAQQRSIECRSFLNSRADPLLSTFDDYAAKLLAR